MDPPFQAQVHYLPVFHRYSLDSFVRKRLLRKGVFYALLGDRESCVAVGVQGAVHDSGFPLLTRFSEVDAVRAGVGDHIASCWPGGVAEEGVWLGLHLVGDDNGDVEDLGQSQEAVDHLVEALLAVREGAPSHVLGAVEADDAVDDEELGLVLLDEAA